MKEIVLAVIGVSGVVGRTILKVLEEKNLDVKEYVFFASKKSAGQSIFFNKKEYFIKELKQDSFDTQKIDIALFSAGSQVSKIYAQIASKRGCIVIDNSSVWRMCQDVPLVVPEVNLCKIKQNKGIIANPNCSTIQAVVVLNPLHQKYKIKRIVYSTYQAVSGAGYRGYEDLQRTISGGEAQYFSHKIFNNCIPHIDTFDDDGYTKEEKKLINETKKILDDDSIKITATAVRVPVADCHSESINIEFCEDFEINQIIEILKNTQGVIVQDDINNNIYPLASYAKSKDEVFVGRIRRDYSVDYGINLWIVSDNLRKGAATNAVQIASEIINILMRGE